MRALSSPCSNRTPGDWQQQEEEEAMKPLFVPYVRGLSERLEKVCTPLGVRPIFKLQNTLRRMLMQVKDRTPMGNKKEIVYEVPCHDCEMKYIGETKRSMKKRVAEHRYAVKKEDVQNGIAVHVQRFHHSINWESARVCASASGYWYRRTLEAIQIRKEPHTMNLDCGLQLSSVWNPVLDPT